MNQNQSALWTKLASFSLDEPGAQYPFSRKLSDKQGWSLPYTERTIEEYKKFVFLCFAAGHPCSPSDAVDEVWHLHLTYTVSYWTQMVGTVLPGPLHHEPSLGGESEDAKFSNMYEKTLSSYQALFGSLPPTDIWPEPSPQPSPAACETQAQETRRPARWIVPALFVMAVAGFLGCESDPGPLGRSDQVAGDLGTVVLVWFGFIFALIFIGIIGTVKNGSGTNKRRRYNECTGSFDVIDGPASDSNPNSGEHSATHTSSHAGSHDGGSSSHGGHSCGGHGGGHSCGGHGCGGHGCGGHG